MFIFPSGLQLKYSFKDNFPIPTYFTFVFTDEKGGHMFVACLQFYERVSDDNARLITDQYNILDESLDEVSIRF